MSNYMAECLGCGSPVAGEFKLCPICSSKSDVGMFAKESIRDKGFLNDYSPIADRRAEISRDKGYISILAVLSVSAIAVIGHLALVYSHLLSGDISLWFDHLC